MPLLRIRDPLWAIHKRDIMKIILNIILIFIFFSCQKEKSTELDKIYLIEEELQQVQLSVENDTLIIGRKGTLLYIERNSFERDNGDSIDGVINMELQEVYEISEILRNKISTVSGNRLLATNGMIKIKATANGEELKLKPGKGIKVFFPKKSKEEDKEMLLFYGSTNEDGITEWKEADDSKEISDYYHNYYIYGEGHQDIEYNEFSSENGAEKMLDSLIEFSEADKEYLLNKSVTVHYIIFADGKLDYLGIPGEVKGEIEEKFKRGIEKYPKMSPIKREGKDYDMTGYFSISTQLTDEAYMKYLEEKIRSSGGITGLSHNEFEQYIFAVNKLGWINCDYFIENDEERINVLISSKKSENIIPTMVFREYDTVLRGRINKNNEIAFEGIPRGEEVIIALIDEEKGELLLSMTDIKVEEERVSVNKFEQVGFDELVTKLDNLK